MSTGKNIESRVPIEPLLDWLNAEGKKINLDNELLQAQIEEFPLPAAAPAVARRERALGSLGARQSMHADLQGLVIALSADQAGKLDNVEAFED